MFVFQVPVEKGQGDAPVEGTRTKYNLPDIKNWNGYNDLSQEQKTQIDEKSVNGKISSENLKTIIGDDLFRRFKDWYDLEQLRLKQQGSPSRPADTAFFVSSAYELARRAKETREKIGEAEKKKAKKATGEKDN